MFTFRKSILVLGIFCALTITATAKPRTIAKMKEAAGQAINAERKARMLAPRNGQLKELKRTNTYSVIGYDGGGFAIVSADDLVPEVLGVSQKEFSNGRNTNLAWWMEAMDKVISYAVANQMPLKTTKPDPSIYPVQVGPLMTTEWDQERPYNNMCPLYRGTTRCLTGCVATAMAQVLNYHKSPEHGIGSRTIYYPFRNTSGEAVTANFSEDFYDWDNMKDTYTSYNETQANAVALLMRDCGVAADMQYDGPSEGSGAYSEDAAAGLRTYFGFTEAQYLERDSYSESAWMDIVYRELSENGPLYYAGADYSNGGHAFVLHGYRSDGMVYVNWGWSGDDDGYYDISILNPAYYRFNYGQDMIIGVKSTPRDLQDVEVSLSDAGKLQETLSATNVDMESIGSLKITGKINSTDIRHIRQLGGRDENGGRVKGYLKTLDLSNAEIVAGGEYYLKDGAQTYTTTDNELPVKAFYGMSFLKDVRLPGNIRHYGAGALGWCPQLETVELVPAADADFVLENDIVWNLDKTEIIAVLCSKTGDLEIPEGTTILKECAFSGCSKVSKVTLPKSIQLIEKECFYGAAGITELRTSHKEPIALGGANVFTGMTLGSCVLSVPRGYKTRYQRTVQWKDFSNISEYGTSVKVRNLIRVYGEENPEFTYTVDGDAVDGTPVLTCNAIPSSPAGRYAITISPGTITSENVDYIDGYLVVQRAPLAVSFAEESYTRKQYENDPEFTLAYNGFLFDDDASMIDVAPTIVCEATYDSPEGEYVMTLSGGSDDCYELSYGPEAKLIISGVAEPTAVKGILLGNDATADIYTANGVLVRKDAVTLEGLDKGIYIIRKSSGTIKFIVK